MNEQILAVSNRIINEKINADFKNFIKIKFSDFGKILEYGNFYERNKIESDNNFRQIIPYVVFKNKENKILVLKRTQNQGEKRLHNKISIGIGGHINKNDIGISKEQTFFNGMDREINEELWLTSNSKYIYKGIINDDSEEVSNVHLGILFIGFVEHAEIKEVENFQSKWLKKEEILQMPYVNLEGWTKIALENI
ncbi:NUDIX hydrolase [Petrotoga sp. 9PWA.NaAc.5.4]|uniref:NUDIX hydrolase n=1 Tax=Petrotoga sp. 9PWA.NaAc.5.4 TaxID=1434328 RepID=UPI000CC85A9F|nr:NUDIX hydrolase [Petrotoga sp. 9PWA.NaAc.5.4]PNR95771.1 DNA mismatch repair protein MutT [Petrotoga sp. 9PWA.NaAc.5.4]